MTKILVIDDNDSLRKLVVRMLEQAGHEALAANNGRSGLELFLKEQPELTITDVLMPDMDGIEVVSELRKTSPDAKVIMMSGGGKGGSGKDYLSSAEVILDVKHILTKPFAKEDLLAMVEQALQEK